MKHNYIVNFEHYKNGVIAGWGNHAVEVTSDDTPAAEELIYVFRKEAGECMGCEPNKVRIVGVFKL